MINFLDSGSEAGIKQEYSDGLSHPPPQASNSFGNGTANSASYITHNSITGPGATETKMETADYSVPVDKKNITGIASPKSTPGGNGLPLLDASDLIHVRLLLSLQRLNDAAQAKWDKTYEIYALEMQKISRLQPDMRPTINPPGPPPHAYAEIYLPTPESLPSFPWQWNRPVGPCHPGNAGTLLDFLNMVYKGGTQYAIPNVDIRPLFDIAKSEHRVPPSYIP